jgi:hypothetical protein
MAEWWDARNTRWETLFDEAVALASQRRLSDTLSMLKRNRELDQPATVVELCDQYLKLDPLDGCRMGLIG